LNTYTVTEFLDFVHHLVFWKEHGIPEMDLLSWVP
jgi:hypothetical protein